MDKKTIIFIIGLASIVLFCKKNATYPSQQEIQKNKEESVLRFDDSLMISPDHNMKTWTGKEIKNTALMGKWKMVSRVNDNYESPDILLTVNRDGKFTLSIPDDTDEETIEVFNNHFSTIYEKGKSFNGLVKCYDLWCAGGEGPDGSYVVGFFDQNGNPMHYYGFVYCQINNNEFTFDEIQGNNIYWDLIPIPLRKFDEIKYPEDN